MLHDVAFHNNYYREMMMDTSSWQSEEELLFSIATMTQYNKFAQTGLMNASMFRFAF